VIFAMSVAQTQSSVLSPQSSASNSFEFSGVVRLTKIGTTYLIFTCLIGFAALNTGNNALYIGLTFMLGCLLLSGMASKGGLKHLAVEVFGVDDAWAGRPADGWLRVSNSSRLWNVRDVIITSGDLAKPVLIPLLARRSSIDVPVSFLFQQRGRVEVKRLDFYTRYPFGFFLKKRRLRLASEVVVFPRLLDDAAREKFRPAAGEQNATNRPGPGSDIHSFREYVRGDSLRQVYWKKSASLGRWIMKQPELEAGRAVHVVVDPYKPRGVSDEEFEQMVSAATTYLYHAVRRGLDVMLTLPRTALRASEAQTATAMFRALALLEPIHEPVQQHLDRSTVFFSVAGDS
jgi:uncharacterized protein (DUF58 family)